MKEVVFVPAAAQEQEGKPATFEGEITLRRPNFDERYEWISEFSEEAQGIAKLDESEDPAVKSRAQIAQIPLLRKMVKKSAGYYVKVSLKHKASGTSFESFEDLTMDSVCDAILMEVAQAIMGGLGPSKK